MTQQLPATSPRLLRRLNAAAVLPRHPHRRVRLTRRAVPSDGPLQAHSERRRRASAGVGVPDGTPCRRRAPRRDALDRAPACSAFAATSGTCSASTLAQTRYWRSSPTSRARYSEPPDARRARRNVTARRASSVSSMPRRTRSSLRPGSTGPVSQAVGVGTPGVVDPVSGTSDAGSAARWLGGDPACEPAGAGVPLLGAGRQRGASLRPGRTVAWLRAGDRRRALCPGWRRHRRRCPHRRRRLPGSRGGGRRDRLPADLR